MTYHLRSDFMDGFCEISKTVR